MNVEGGRLEVSLTPSGLNGVSLSAHSPVLGSGRPTELAESKVAE